MCPLGFAPRIGFHVCSPLFRTVTDLIMATREDDILRRDIFDRPPTMTWYKGRVVLLGDSAHAMQVQLCL